MLKAEFIIINEELEKFKYTSMKYTDYSEVAQYKVLSRNERLILLSGYNEAKGLQEYHWACNEVNDLLTSIDQEKGNIIITFVPRDWVPDLIKAGYQVDAIFNDYFNPDISNIVAVEAPEFLTEEESEAAAAVTMSCRGQSRGFHGETQEWIRSWIKEEDPSIQDTEAKHSAILIHREEGQIVGVICTAVYAFQSEKGPISWIREVAVHPDYQKRGIARKLIHQALYYGRVNGATRAFLAADECNGHAIHLYEKLGFVGNKDEAQIDMVKL